MSEEPFPFQPGAMLHDAIVGAFRAQTRRLTRGSGEPVRRLRHVHSSEAEAARAADAALSGAGRDAMKLTAERAGFSADLLAGATVVFADMRPELNGEWHLTRVTHRLTGSGLITSLEATKGKT